MDLGDLDNGLRMLGELQGLSPFVSTHWCLTYLHTFTAKGGAISVEKLRSLVSKITQTQWFI